MTLLIVYVTSVHRNELPQRFTANLEKKQTAPSPPQDKLIVLN